METSDDENLYTTSIRQILDNLAPILKLSWSASAAEEMMVNLESTDENFHKYDLVRHIKDRIEKEIGPLVDNTIDQQKAESEDQRLFPLLTETIMSSMEYNRLSQSVLCSVRAASEKILQSIYDNQDYPLSSGTELLTRSSHNWISGNDVDSMLSSSFEGDLLFASVERYEKIASDLKPSNPREIRIDALNSLNHIPQSDIAASENWHVIKNRISNALMDDDSKIVEKSLRFHAKMFACGTSHLTREIYLSLCQGLIANLKTNLVKEVHLGDYDVLKVLKQLRLLNQFQHYLPLYWIRYPAKTVQELINVTIDLFSIGAYKRSSIQSETFVTPLHLLSILDLKADWFKKWMHGSHSRTSLIRKIAKEPALLHLACKSVVQFCTSCSKDGGMHKSISLVDKKKELYSLEYLDYALFVHSTNIIEQLLLYKEARDIFPVKIMDSKSITLQSLFVTLIDVLKFTDITLDALFSETGHVHPGFLVVNLIKSITKVSSRATLASFCNDEVTSALLKPVQDLMQNSSYAGARRSDSNEVILILIADMLASLAVTSYGREHLLYGDKNCKWQLSLLAPAFIIVEFTRKALLGSLNPQPTRGVIDSFLFVCKQLCNTGEGLYVLGRFDLSKCICIRLDKTKKDWQSVTSNSNNVSRLFSTGEKGAQNIEYTKRHTQKALDVFSLTDSFSSLSIVPEQQDLISGPSKPCYRGCTDIFHDMGGRYDLNGLPFFESLNHIPNIKILFSSLLSKKEDISFHELSLLDNLLGFASSPKGVLLIQQGGYLTECVKYLYIRHRHRFQVSRIESYGYGVLLSQIAATPPGIIALESTGFIKDLLEDIWMMLEGGGNDYQKTILPVYNEDMNERHCQKLFCSLVNILSPFPGVPELISRYPVMSCTPDMSADEPLTSQNAPPIPFHLQEFFNQVVFLDNNRKLKLLYHLDFTHLFGLRVLNSIVCCLDTSLLFETRYRYQEILLKLQADFQPENGLFMIDALSLERNQILVRSYLIGGFSERIVPPKTLSKDPKFPFKWPLFSSFPVPQEYSMSSCKKKETETEGESIVLFPFNSAKPEAWLAGFQETFINLLTKEDSMGICRETVKHILSNVCQLQLLIKKEAIFRTSEYAKSDTLIRAVQLTEIETLGMDLVLRYGRYLGLLTTQPEAKDGLQLLYRRCRHYLREQQRSCKSEMLSLHSDYIGFDWFLGTVFLIFQGNADEAWVFLHRFSSLAASGYLWAARLHLSAELASDMIQSGIHPLYSSVCHNVQLLLQSELPQVYSAFRMSGYTSSQICQLWLRQCFWNYLDWDEICLYLCICLVMGIDYQVYFCVSIMKHMEKDILFHSNQKDLLVFLKEEPIKYFQGRNYLKWMISLEKMYRAIVLTDMLNSLK